VQGALTVFQLSKMSTDSINRTETAVFTLLLHYLFPEDNITRMFSCQMCNRCTNQ